MHLSKRKSFYNSYLLCHYNRICLNNKRCCGVALKDIANGYKPKVVELGPNELWKKENKERKHDLRKEKFSMILPPPNVTGNLHLGHSLTCTIEDVLIRWKKKMNFDTVWVPGQDHAGIATQIVVEKILKKEKQLSRHQIGKEEFINEIWKWKNQKENSINDDLSKMGSCLDWSREFFTLDEKQSFAVQEAFIRLFNDGLIYRGDGLINWSCAIESAISDVEVDNIEITGPTSLAIPGYEKNITFGLLYDIAYKICDSDKEIIVSTTRPETLLGDVAIAINPNDDRYLHLDKLKNNKVWHPFRKEEIKIIYDESVDINFGTGAVKITPAHDKNDFDLSKRHNLPIISVIDEKGKICNNYENYSNIPRFMARDKILNDLTNLGLYRSKKNHTMVLPMCSRSNDVVEYLIKPQWFVKCEKMCKAAMEAVESGSLKIYPDIFKQNWYNWLSENKDWCISRQLWWGHNIPAYNYKLNKVDKWVAAKSEPEAIELIKKNHKNIDLHELHLTHDPDVLDTWFSSCLLPFSSFGWPNNSADYQRYYPLNLMETGHDILFFWVARMVMLGIQLTGKLPFNEILLHGIICDSHGRKMSKSLGNVISPKQIINGTTLEELRKSTEEMYALGILNKNELKKSLDGQAKIFPNGIPECGTDALRFTLLNNNIKNHFINFDVQQCYTNKLFFNKIWQATRYTLTSYKKMDLFSETAVIEDSLLLDMDKWILGKLSSTINTIEKAMNDYNFHLATAGLKTFYYTHFCDIYLETTKPYMLLDENIFKNQCHILGTCLTVGLEYMQIFTPYLCAELLGALPKNVTFNKDKWLNARLEEDVEKILEICEAIRTVKSINSITKKHKPEAYLLILDDKYNELIKSQLININSLTQCNKVNVEEDVKKFDEMAFSIKSTAGHLCRFGIMSDKKNNKEINKTLNTKKIIKLETELEKLLEIVSSDGYKSSANINVQKKHIEKIEKLKTEIFNIKRIEIV